MGTSDGFSRFKRTMLRFVLVRTLTTIASFVLCICIICTLAAAQKEDKEKPNGAEVKFTSRTELVLVPTVVTDKSGNHIAGLKKEDFTILENGSERQVATFEEITSDPVRLSRPLKPNEFSNSLSVSGRATRRITLIVLDVLNTSSADQAYLRNQLLKYLSQSLDSREPTGLYVLDRRGVHVIHDFTSDPRVLIAALHKVLGQPSQLVDTPGDVATVTGAANPVGSATGGVSGMTAGPSGPPVTALMSAVSAEAAALQTAIEDSTKNFESFQQRVAITYTLDAMQQVAQQLAGIPGRKALIWASGGFPFSVSDTTMELALPAQATMADVRPQYERTWQLLNDAQIAVYAVDVKGPQPDMPTASTEMKGGTAEFSNDMRSVGFKQVNTQATFETFAAATGGRAYLNSNDLTKGFRDAVRDSAQYYMIGYYLDRSNPKTGWRKLAVKVKRDHVEVRARNGFFVTNATENPEATNDSDIALALKSPLDYTALSLVAHWDDVVPSKEAGKKSVRFIVHIEPDSSLIDVNDKNHVELDFVAVATTANGEQAGLPVGKKFDLHLDPSALATTRQKGISYRGALDLAPGEYSVRIVARDELNGRVGSVAAPLNVE